VRLADLLMTQPAATMFYEVVATIGDGTVANNRELATVDSGQTLLSIVDMHGVDHVVVGQPKRISEALLADLTHCFERGIPVIPATALYEQLTGRVMAAALEADWYADIPTRHGVYGRVKRIVDVVAASAALVVALPVMFVVGIATLIDSGSPILYRQVRVGRGGTHFTLHKFRSMHVGAESAGAMWAAPNDSRSTRVGRFLRRSRLDELPQLFDVVRGDMSLIGPRPERPEFTQQLLERVPLYRLRTVVRPGISGWAQVSFPYAASIDENLTKLEYDLFYIRRMGPVLDLVIALRTLGTLLGLRGR